MTGRDMFISEMNTKTLRPFRKKSGVTGAEIDPINRALVDRYQRGDHKAFDELSRLNQGLVYRGVRMIRSYGVQKDDLVQEGYLGLMTAAVKFKSSYQNAFTTYAMWWVRATAQRFVFNTFSDIRIPIGTREKFTRILDVLEKQNISVGERGFLRAATEVRVPHGEALRIYKGFVDLQSIVPLDAKLGNEDPGSLSEVLGDACTVDPVVQLCADEEAESIIRHIERLLLVVHREGTTERYRAFAAHYLHTDGVRTMTAESLGKRVSSSVNAIRKVASGVWTSIPHSLRIRTAVQLSEEIERLTVLVEHRGIPIADVLKALVRSASA
jgi:RNA polymerase sigma factor (sigma-70 family)